MLTPEMVATVQERMSCMYVDYRRYMDVPQLEYSSIGLVARFGGEKTAKTYKITKLTEAQAIERANRPPEVVKKIAWLECAWDVYTRLVTGRSGSGAAKRRNRKIAHVMYLHVFLGWTFTKISAEPLPGTDKPVARQRIYNLYKEAVELVAEEAVRRGLLPEP